MARYYRALKTLVQGRTYRLSDTQFWVIKRLGTNSAGRATLKIQESEVGYIDSEVAPMHKLTSNLLGPLDLEDLFYVVNPKEKIEVVGDSGCKMLVDVLVGELEHGESIPSEYAMRKAEQHRHYKTMFSGNFSLGTNVKWLKNDVKEILSLTPLTTEELILNDVIMVSITGGTVNEGDFAVIFKLGNIPFELDPAKVTIDATEVLLEGIDVKYMPKPPKEDTEMQAFTLRDFPITVKGDQTLSILVKNISGSDKTPATDSSWTVDVKLIARYKRAA